MHFCKDEEAAVRVRPRIYDAHFAGFLLLPFSVLLRKSKETTYMTKPAFLLLFLTGSWGMHNAAAAVDCHIRIVAPVTDDLGNHWKRGQIVPVDIQRSQANHITYCAHGGSCFPAVTNQRQTARLTDCRAGKKIDDEDRVLIPLKSADR